MASIRCFLWLWHRPVATALIGPLSWEPPYAMIVALEGHTHTKYLKKCNIFYDKNIQHMGYRRNETQPNKGQYMEATFQQVNGRDVVYQWKFIQS